MNIPSFDSKDMSLEFQEKADPRTLTHLDKISQAMAILYNSMKNNKIVLPKIFQIKGEVEVIKQSPVRIDNLEELGRYFQSLETQIIALKQAVSMVPPKVDSPVIEFPKDIFKGQDNSRLIEEIGKLQETMLEVANQISKNKVKMPKTISVDNFPPQMIPQPVTNINLNALQGFVKATNNTVTSTVTPLPIYGVLANRRTLMLYNNSSQTVYIGGSDVTTSSGLPVPANAYSPAIDGGVNMITYGIVASGSADVRVIELSTEASGR